MEEQTGTATNVSTSSESMHNTILEEFPTTRPGMRAVRRRSHRRRSQRRSSRVDTDLRFRQLRIALLAVILSVLVYVLTPQSLHQKFSSAIKQIFRPFRGVIGGLHLEVVALLIAAVVLLYLTPGVEDFVMRLLGIRRTTSTRR